MLVRMNVLDLRTAIGLILAIEAALFLVASRQVIVVTRRYRRERRAGLDRWDAFEEGLAVVLPPVVAKFVAAEIRLPTYLFQRLTGRTKLREGEFSYHRGSLMGPLFVVVLFTAPVEILLFELLVPWAWLRWLLLILGVYGVVWMGGLYASLRALPHRLEPDALRLNHGILASARVPYGAIAEAEPDQSKSESEGLRVSPDGAVAYLAVGGKTQVTVKLTTPVSLQGFVKPTPPVDCIRFAVDEPDALIESLRSRIPLSKSPGPVDVALDIKPAR